MSKILTVNDKHKFILDRILGEYRKKESEPIEIIKRVYMANNLRNNPSNLTPCDIIELISILDEVEKSKKITKDLLIELKTDIAKVMNCYNLVLIRKEKSIKHGHSILSKHKTVV